MLDARQRQAIRGALWQAFAILRGSADASIFRNHILALLVLKYLSDREHRQVCDRREPFQQAVHAFDFESLLSARTSPDIGQRIDGALAELEARHPMLRGVFQDTSFVSTFLGSPARSKHVLSELLTCFNAPEFNFRTPGDQASEAVAFACETLIGDLAAASGRRGDAFFTPPEVSQLIASLMRPEPEEDVCDPCCGSGTLLLSCSRFAQDLRGRPCRLFGQEKNYSTWALARINMVLHEEESAHLEWGDTLREPRLLTNGRLQKFDVVVSSLPFNLKDWGHELAARDPHGRYSRGIPPRAAGDYAFISHMLETLNPGNGRMAVVVSLGVLFRGGAEQQIRERLLRENLVDAVIGLPAKMFAHTAIPAALLVLRQKKRDDRVMFIDASRDYEHGKTQHTLREMDVTRIEGAYLGRQDIHHYARAVPLDEILSNDSNLSVARYVDAPEEVSAIDLGSLRAERARLKAEVETLEAKLSTLLREVDHG